MIGSIAALFGFTVRQTLLDRKIWLSAALLSFPSLMALLIRRFMTGHVVAGEVWELYHITAHFLLMLLVIPLVCLLQGTSVIRVEVESRTITYLITRRLRRWMVLLVKFAATFLVVTLLCELGMLALHWSTTLGLDLDRIMSRPESSAFRDWLPADDAWSYLQVIPMAVAGYLSLFGLISMLTNKVLAVAVSYWIIVEVMISNIPADIRTLTLMHPLRVSLVSEIPRLRELYELPRALAEEIYPQDGSGLVTILIWVAICLALSLLLMTVRELVPSKLSRE